MRTHMLVWLGPSLHCGSRCPCTAGRTQLQLSELHPPAQRKHPEQKALTNKMINSVKIVLHFSLLQSKTTYTHGSDSRESSEIHLNASGQSAPDRCREYAWPFRSCAARAATSARQRHTFGACKPYPGGHVLRDLPDWPVDGRTRQGWLPVGLVGCESRSSARCIECFDRGRPDVWHQWHARSGKVPPTSRQSPPPSTFSRTALKPEPDTNVYSLQPVGDGCFSMSALRYIRDRDSDAMPLTYIGMDIVPAIIATHTRRFGDSITSFLQAGEPPGPSPY